MCACACVLRPCRRLAATKESQRNAATQMRANVKAELATGQASIDAIVQAETAKRAEGLAVARDAQLALHPGDDAAARRIRQQYDDEVATLDKEVQARADAQRLLLQERIAKRREAVELRITADKEFVRRASRRLVYFCWLGGWNGNGGGRRKHAGSVCVCVCA